MFPARHIEKVNRKYLDAPAQNSILPSWREALDIAKTFLIVLLCWVFFRAANITEAFDWLKIMFGGWFDMKDISEAWKPCRDQVRLLPWLFLILLVVEWINRRCEYGLARLPGNRILRYLIYWSLILGCLFMRGQQQTFIYFQF